jgi:hypothetical protein
MFARRVDAVSFRSADCAALAAEAAIEVGLSSWLASHLAMRYDELKPWREVREVLDALRRQGLALGVVTNCSEELGASAAARTGFAFMRSSWPDEPVITSPIPDLTICRLPNRAWRQAVACSSQAPPMICSARESPDWLPFGATALACLG